MKISVHFYAYPNQIFIGVKNISRKSCREKWNILESIHFIQNPFFFIIEHYA